MRLRVAVAEVIPVALDPSAGDGSNPLHRYGQPLVDRRNIDLGHSSGSIRGRSHTSHRSRGHAKAPVAETLDPPRQPVGLAACETNTAAPAGVSFLPQAGATVQAPGGRQAIV